MTRVRRRGFSLAELLAVLAVMSLITLSLATFLPAVDREARRVDERARRLEADQMMVERLTADVRRSRGVRRLQGGLLLETEAGEIRWQRTADRLVRSSAGHESRWSVDAEPQLVARARGSVVVLEFDGRRVIERVGAGR